MTGLTSGLDVGFENDLRAALAGRAPHDVPSRLLEDASRERAWQRGIGPVGWVARIAGASASALALVVVAVLMWTVVFGTRAIDPATIGDGHAAHSWGTHLVAFEADSLAIEVGGLRFTAPAEMGAHSDSGTATYRTLELSWSEQQVQMRLYLYFAADTTDWWVTSIRSYDGTSPGDWIYYVTPRIQASLGQTWIGDVDMLGLGVHGVGRVRIEDLRLMAFAAGTIPHFQDGCRMAGRAGLPGQQYDSPANPDIPGVTLAVGMSATQAERQLRDAAVCFEFHLEYPASNLNQRWCVAPPGNITDWAFGSDGRVILFVEATPTLTLPPDAPEIVGC